MSRPTTRLAAAALCWAAGSAALWALDGRVDLANLAMVLVLTSAVAALWLPLAGSVASNLLALAAFNWAFVPPRGSFTIDLRQHAVLLAAMLVVNSLVAALMAALRAQARRAERHAARSQALQAWGDTLRDAVDPLAHAGELQQRLAAVTGVPVGLRVLKRQQPDQDDDDATLRVGPADADQAAGLWHCLRQGQALGPGSGRHDELPDTYLPLRGRGASFGAAVLCGWPPDAEVRAHAQALCDALGQALQRAQSAREAAQAREQAQEQRVRTTLLAALSHDFRTPLAVIMGAASSLDEQADKLAPEQRRRLARSIVDETTQLVRLADNTLQLARLDGPGVVLRCDWEAAEDLVGAVLQRARRHAEASRLRARLEPALPLLWCDALRVSQLLDNLVDNALKYSPAEAPVELLVRLREGQAVLSVRDRGPGVAPAWRERIFEVFHRGAAAMDPSAAEPSRPGTGIGLAVCRAIARAHGGELRLRGRAHGGCSFEFWLPLRDAPEAP